MRTIVFAIASLVILVRDAAAFPQNDLASKDGELDYSFEVDGFVFDGPADRPVKMPLNLTDNPRNIPTSTVPTRSTSTTTSTSTPKPTPGYDDCISRCPVTPEYNPICGSDRQEYNNPGWLSCAQACGRSVILKHHGRCTPLVGSVVL